MSAGEMVQISFRAPVEQAHALEQMARANDRTVSGEIRHALRRHMAEEAAKAERPAPLIPGQLDLDGAEAQAA